MGSKGCPFTEVCAPAAMRPVATITVATGVVCCIERGRSVTFATPSAFQSTTTTVLLIRCVCVYYVCDIY